MSTPNAAQQLRAALGVEAFHGSEVLGRNPSATKKGPGRIHKSGLKSSKPSRRGNAGPGFVQHTNPNKAESRCDKRRRKSKLHVLLQRIRFGIVPPKPAKPAKQRKHVQHRHATRDAHGAVTLIGPVVYFDGVPMPSNFYQLGGTSDGESWGRRIWLGGVSARRGF